MAYTTVTSSASRQTISLQNIVRTDFNSLQRSAGVLLLTRPMYNEKQALRVTQLL